MKKSLELPWISEKKLTVTGLCSAAGMSRQAYAKGLKQRKCQSVDAETILTLVDEVRALHPEMGAEKLLDKIRPRLEGTSIRIGRDRFYELLREHDRLILPKKRYVVTTDSEHGYRVYRNLVNLDEPVEVSRPNQVWVSDITYLKVGEGFMFLSLVMDLHSRKIIGHALIDTLEAQGPLKALRQALRQRPPGVDTIHHSDRGCQYCSHRYIRTLKQAGVRISMTEKDHCYENAAAERLNGILKYEYGLRRRFLTAREASLAVKQAVWLYNDERPHRALGMKTPTQVHRAA